MIFDVLKKYPKPGKARFKSTFKNYAEDLQWTSLKSATVKLEIICTMHMQFANQ